MISRFFSWWFSELAGLLPAGGSGSRSSGRVLVIELQGDQVRVGVQGARVRERVVPRSDDARIRDAVQGVAAALDPARTRVQLRLPAEMALTTEPSLPLAAEENLREVLGFEMDRLTPFRAVDVFSSFEIRGRDREKQSLSVRLNVVRRKLVEPMLAGLESWALAPSAQELARSRGGAETEQVFLDFVPASFRQRSSGALNAVLGIAVVALALFAMFLPMQAQREYRDALESDLNEARVEASRALQVREQMELERSAARTVAEAKGARPSTVQVLDAVTQLLPDHTYLFRFQLEGDELNVQGNSQAASSLIALLDANEWLTNVRFVSPVTRDARSGGERFHISARLMALRPVADPPVPGG